MENSRFGFAFLPTVIILVLLASGAYLYTQKSVAPVITPTPAPITTPDNSFKTLPTPSLVADGCSIISNSTFQSVDKYEAGNSPNGPVLGYYATIVFQDTGFSWTHSDVQEAGTYSCVNNLLQATFYLSGPTDYDRLAAHYDNDRGVLTWNGVEYRKVK